MAHIASIILSIFLVSVAPSFAQFNQRAVLYDQYNGEGNYVVIPEDYISDLSTIGFNDKTASVCVTGIWLFYQDPDYNPSARGMEYVFGRDNYCVNIRTIAGSISSVRYAGGPKDYREDSFTLYVEDYFQGDEEYTRTNLPNLNLAGNHKSIIITGNSDWTVYDQPSYKGNTVCLQVPEPGNSTPSFVYDTEKLEQFIPHGSIRSVTKGCSSHVQHNFTLTSFARMNAMNTFEPSTIV